MSTPRPGQPLVRRLVGAVLVAGTVAAVLGSAVMWTVARSGLRAEIAEGNAALADELAIRMDARLGHVVDTLRLVATREGLTGPGPVAAGELRAALTASVMFDELIVFDERGRAVAAAAARFLADPGDYPARPGVTDGLARGPVATVLDGFPLVLEVRVPLARLPGAVDGALIGRVPLEVVAAPILQRDPASTAVAFLVDGDGRMLVHPERDRVADGARFGPAVDGDPTGATWLEVEGVPSLVVLSATTSLDGAVVLQHAESDVLRPAARQLGQLIATLVVTLAAAIAAASVAGGYLLRPLRPLAAAVDRLEQGERGVVVDVRTTDEIGQLGRQLNRMSASLDRRRGEVEELHRLSLLLGSRGDREQVVGDITSGAGRLLSARGVIFLTVGGDPPAVEALAGIADPVAARSAAARCAEAAAAVTEQHDEERLVAVPVPGGEGETLGVLVAVRDGRAFDAEDVRLAQAFASFAGVALQAVHRLDLERQLVHHLQEAVDRRRDLITAVTHEFLTPLTCIESFSARLADTAEPPADERRRLAAEIHDQARVLEELLTRLLDLAMSERGQRTVAPSPVRLRTVVGAALTAVGPVLGGRPVDTDLPELEVLADNTALVRVLTNLLSNAVKYSPPATPLAVRARVEGDMVRIEVVDEGEGMRPEDAARVFEPFWRGPAGTTARGMGVGLALVADHVRAMGGAVAVVSTPGRGSTFSFTVPRVVADA